MDFTNVLSSRLRSPTDSVLERSTIYQLAVAAVVPYFGFCIFHRMWIRLRRFATIVKRSSSTTSNVKTRNVVLSFFHQVGQQVLIPSGQVGLYILPQVVGQYASSCQRHGYDFMQCCSFHTLQHSSLASLLPRGFDEVLCRLGFPRPFLCVFARFFPAGFFSSFFYISFFFGWFSFGGEECSICDKSPRSACGLQVLVPFPSSCYPVVSCGIFPAGRSPLFHSI